MKKAVVFVPVLFLIGLIYLAYGMYQGTVAHTPCVGDECAALNSQQLADMALSAEQQ